MLRSVVNTLFVCWIAVFTIQDIRNAECNIGCHKEGFDAGFFVQKQAFCENFAISKRYYDKGKCACLTILDYRDATGKTFTLHMTPEHKAPEGPSDYFTVPGEFKYDE
jgi:hypothetical protein